MSAMAAEAEVDRTLRALADGNRRAILAAIRTESRAVGELAADLGLSQQTTSHHLAVLREAGLVTESRAGVRHLFAVRTDGFAAAREYLDGFWPQKLAALRDVVEAGVQDRNA